MAERRAEWIDTIGRASKQLFARHRETGRRISAGMFYRLPAPAGDGTTADPAKFEREGYVLMTTAKRVETVSQKEKLF